MTFCLVDNATIADIGLEYPFFCGMQPRRHLLSKVGSRERPCAAIVRDFLVPFSTPKTGTTTTTTTAAASKPLALVVQFHALHNPIEDVRLRLSAHKSDETESSCREKTLAEKEEEERRRRMKEKAKEAEKEEEEEEMTESEKAQRRGFSPISAGEDDGRGAEEEERERDEVKIGKRLVRRSHGFLPRDKGQLETQVKIRRKRLSEGLLPGVEAVAEVNEAGEAPSSLGRLSAERLAGDDNDDDDDEKTSLSRRSIFEDGFWCAGTKMCIWRNSTCDGFDSCLDGGSDEMDCPVEEVVTTTTYTTTSATTTNIATTMTRTATSSAGEAESTNSSLRFGERPETGAEAEMTFARRGVVEETNTSTVDGVSGNAESSVHVAKRILL